MNKTEFATHWRRICDKYPKRFQDKEHQTREFEDWFKIFGKNHNSELFDKTLDLWFADDRSNYFPTQANINGFYNRAMVENKLHGEEINKPDYDIAQLQRDAEEFASMNGLVTIQDNIDFIKKNFKKIGTTE